MKVNLTKYHTHLYILHYWLKSVLMVYFLPPRKYLYDLIKRKKNTATLTNSEWRIVKKVARTTKRLQPFILNRSRCLIESMIVHFTLKKYGIQSQIRIGGKKEGGRLTTHAWTTVEGKTIIGGPLKGYRSFSKIQITHTGHHPLRNRDYLLMFF